MIVLAYTFGGILALLFLGLMVGEVRRRWLLRAHHKNLGQMSATALSEEAAMSATRAGFKSDFPEARLFSLVPPTTDAALLQSLRDLWGLAAERDKELGRRGTDRHTHFMYDFGLIYIMELLEERCGEEPRA